MGTHALRVDSSELRVCIDRRRGRSGLQGSEEVSGFTHTRGRGPVVSEGNGCAGGRRGSACDPET